MGSGSCRPSKCRAIAYRFRANSSRQKPGLDAVVRSCSAASLPASSTEYSEIIKPLIWRFLSLRSSESAQFATRVLSISASSLICPADTSSLGVSASKGRDVSLFYPLPFIIDDGPEFQNELSEAGDLTVAEGAEKLVFKWCYNFSDADDNQLSL